MEETVLMLFLEYLLFEVRVQESTRESYFSITKGWHGEEMGYQPASSGLFTTVRISKCSEVRAVISRRRSLNERRTPR